jgi:cytoskeletal protein RodZ
LLVVLDMAELGNALMRARVARGLTLEDVERDTRISGRYLEALEAEDFDTFPATVYTRAFLRTYAQYLGLDAAELLRLFPQQGLEPEIRPLPELSKPDAPAFSINWFVAGAVVLLLLGAGLLLYRSGSGGEEASPPGPPVSAVEGVTEETAPGEVGLTPVPALARPVGPVTPGEVPDLESVDMDSALDALQEADINYVVIEVNNDQVPEGLVIQQDPAPGTKAEPETSVTLVVSRGG